ncbi:hypothetical protein DRE_04140 [Drechslerella stenobrocha 248]|uniref:Uncharacterized protein n=1 Tax=Drechslerella stenobrocha 248 TaxID=1043628 RepID=W7I396_9PEZI|nr:hypothetical protein DRE_04140 [Drechslerella stenobrocha 248]
MEEDKREYTLFSSTGRKNPRKRWANVLDTLKNSRTNIAPADGTQGSMDGAPETPLQENKDDNSLQEAQELVKIHNYRMLVAPEVSNMKAIDQAARKENIENVKSQGIIVPQGYRRTYPTSPSVLQSRGIIGSEPKIYMGNFGRYTSIPTVLGRKAATNPQNLGRAAEPPKDIYIQVRDTNDCIAVFGGDLVGISVVFKDMIEKLGQRKTLNLTEYNYQAVIRVVEWAIMKKFSFVPADATAVVNPANDIYALASKYAIVGMREKFRKDLAVTIPEDGLRCLTCIEYIRVLLRLYTFATDNTTERDDLLELVEQAIRSFSFLEIARATAYLPTDNVAGSIMYRHIIMAKAKFDEHEARYGQKHGSSVRQVTRAVVRFPLDSPTSPRLNVNMARVQPPQIAGLGETSCSNSTGGVATGILNSETRGAN